MLLRDLEGLLECFPSVRAAVYLFSQRCDDVKLRSLQQFLLAVAPLFQENVENLLNPSMHWEML